jgi:hypothetical protein
VASEQGAYGRVGEPEEGRGPQAGQHGEGGERRPGGELVAADVGEGGALGGVAVAHADPADDGEQVAGGEQGAEDGDAGEGEVRGAAQARGGVERAEHREHLAPEAGQARQAQGGDGGEGEQAAQAWGAAVEGGAAAAGEPVEVGGAVAVLDGADEEEEQAGDEAVGDVGEQRAVDACRVEGGDAEQHEAHVADGRVGDEPLEVAAVALAGEPEAGERAVDDADDGEGGQVGREGPYAVRRLGEHDADQAVGAHLQQHSGEQDGADGGGGGVGAGEPAVQRPHRGLDRQAGADGEDGDDLRGVTEM